jgi:hypothetical protein
LRPDDIRPLLEANPFLKFYLNLSDSGCYEVNDPSQVSFTPSGGILIHEAKGRRSYIGLAHVVWIGFPPSGGGNPFIVGSQA